MCHVQADLMALIDELDRQAASLLTRMHKCGRCFVPTELVVYLSYRNTRSSFRTLLCLHQEACRSEFVHTVGLECDARCKQLIRVCQMLLFHDYSGSC